MGVLYEIDTFSMPLKQYFCDIFQKVILCLKWTKKGIISTFMQKKLKDLAVLLQNYAVDADLLCPLENLVVVQFISQWITLHVMERTPHTGTLLCVLDINQHMMLVWINISLVVINQVKIEDIIMPQNTCALGNEYLWISHINVWIFLPVVLLGKVLLSSSIVLLNDLLSNDLW